jgi:NitT/TauT family transport system substrate-binding protein
MRYGPRLIAAGWLAAALCMGAAAQAKEPVRVSMFSWPGYAFLQLAQQKGLVDPNLQLEITIIEDPLQSFSMIASGRLDATFSTAEYGPIAAEQGMPMKVVGLTTFNCGMDKIIVHPKVKEPSDLVGEKVAVMEGGLSRMVNLIMDNAAAAMVGGEIAAGEFWEPYGSQVLEGLPGSRVVASAAEPFWMSTALLSDAIYFSDALIEERRQEALALMRAYYDGKAYWRSHPAEANRIIAEALGFPIADVELVLGGNAEYCETGAYYAPFAVAAQVCGSAPGDPGHHMANGAIFDQWRLTTEWWVKLGNMEAPAEPGKGIDCSLKADLVEQGYAPE